jgi:hypothetical protein
MEQQDQQTSSGGNVASGTLTITPVSGGHHVSYSYQDSDIVNYKAKFIYELT